MLKNFQNLLLIKRVKPDRNKNKVNTETLLMSTVDATIMYPRLLDGGSSAR